MHSVESFIIILSVFMNMQVVIVMSAIMPSVILPSVVAPGEFLRGISDTTDWLQTSPLDLHFNSFHVFVL